MILRGCCAGVVDVIDGHRSRAWSGGIGVARGQGSSGGMCLPTTAKDNLGRSCSLRVEHVDIMITSRYGRVWWGGATSVDARFFSGLDLVLEFACAFLQMVFKSVWVEIRLERLALAIVFER